MTEQEARADPFGAIDDWDAADMGCGELVIFLRQRLKAMPGGVLRLTARDSGAPEDLPAWCRMTRNALIHHDPEAQLFWIRSRTDWS
ncbi:sulfurtransferase TusA family protein [Xanthobacter pseudotagetidis]|uniref:sulfurtransferase TusA family protein n=1 Tax=Xanthobacter pseudotagetidis TaxID=3119911 RepID=UPI00372C7B95